MLACDEGNIEMVDLLLQYSADPNLQQPVSKIEVLNYICTVCCEALRVTQIVCMLLPNILRCEITTKFLTMIMQENDDTYTVFCETFAQHSDHVNISCC